MMELEHATERASARADTDDVFRIGLGVGTFGRWFRLLIGINAIAYLSVNPVLLNPLPTAEIVPYFGEVGLWLLGIIVAYMAGVWCFGHLPVHRLNPWLGTVIFLGVPTLLRMRGFIPESAQVAFGFYIGASLIATFFMRYGGCEVVALPSILFGKRFTMYCPYNAVDAVERGVAPDGFSTGHRWIAILSLAITMLVGGYFLIEVISSFFGRYGLAFDVDPRLAWTLFFPAGHLTFLTISAYRRERRLLAPAVRKFGVGAAVLTLVTFALVSPIVGTRELWLGALAIGTVSVPVGLLVGRMRSDARAGVEPVAGR